MQDVLRMTFPGVVWRKPGREVAVKTSLQLLSIHLLVSFELVRNLLVYLLNPFVRVNLVLRRISDWPAMC